MSNRGQLSLNWEKEDNRLLKSMKEGRFAILFEVDVPSSNCDIETVTSRYAPFLKAVNNIEGFKSSLAFTDKKHSKDSMDMLDFASEICPEHRSDHLVFISGRNKSKAKMINTIRSSIASGFVNIVPVSGAVYKSETSRDLSGVNFFESVSALNLLKEEIAQNPQLNIGTVVNPFKYSQESTHTQYFKLIKKINSGAGFVVSQAGWDILKNQELRWYLETRNYFEPCLGNIILLSPEKIEKIVSDAYRGVFLSPDFLNILNKESRLSVSQFWAAQWRRFQLYVAGLRWMGYSGVIISGLDSESYVNTVASKISGVLKDLSSFENWRESYRSFLSRSEMAPYPYKYYIYKNLLEENYFDRAELTLKDVAPCSSGEKFNFRFSKFKKNFLDGKKAVSKEKIIAAQFYLSPKLCPKGMIQGPCGETNHDNSCCLNTPRECIYPKLFRLASWQKNFDPFE